MAATAYEPASTAVLLIDPYNDFISEGGKLWPLIRAVAQEVGALEHMRQIIGAARELRIRIFIVPHHRAQPTDYAGWRFPNPDQIGSNHIQAFAQGTWGGEWHPDFVPKDGDVIIKEHWAQSGFANTDLDQQLKQHGVSKVILIGMIANTCVESSARFAMELGYHVTLVKDATAAFSHDRMHAAHALNGPSFAHAILTTPELIAALTKVDPAPAQRMTGETR